MLQRSFPFVSSRRPYMNGSVLLFRIVSRFSLCTVRSRFVIYSDVGEDDEDDLY